MSLLSACARQAGLARLLRLPPPLRSPFVLARSLSSPAHLPPSSRLFPPILPSLLPSTPPRFGFASARHYTPTVDKAQEKIREVMEREESGDNKWEALWQNKSTPWDTGSAAPPLLDLIKSEKGRQLNFERVLVPGSGSGYDTIAIAKAFPAATVVNVDISETAVQRFQQLCRQEKEKLDNIESICSDFFTLDGGFTLIWDYTFLSALPPSMRQDWANQMAKLLTPGGVLVHLMFPVGDFEGGPPFALTYDSVASTLEKAGLVTLDRDLSPASHPARKGREELVMYKKPEEE
uniref:Methyltransferase domain-containing protein n=1 Tax=Palpitomonas bilix TaxID=652834 RepID=A0A7S3DE91_9EUKA|mmetsp:Transcript_3404/g.6701  ORF Transcript_3404/g.6701 Transcript_3404/m.6701 type:complete len:292 (+) Transcript_3404:88-963(+)